jgi:hypothetical protein
MMTSEHGWGLQVPLMSDPQWAVVMRALGVAVSEPDSSSTATCADTDVIAESDDVEVEIVV